MRNKILLLIEIVFSVFVLCSCVSGIKEIADAMPVDLIADSGVQQEEDAYVYTGNGSDWCSALFEKPSTQYENSLALVAAKLSEAAENEQGNMETIKQIFSEYDLYACEYEHFDGTDPIFSEGGAFAIGQDTLTIDGVNVTMLVIVARGTINLREMTGDYFHGGENDFLGEKVYHNVYEFEEKIWDGLDAYVEKYPAIRSVEHLKILVTGHSLGGAAANLAGARLTYGIGKDEWYSDKISQEDVYVYTYGAIKALTTAANVSEGYENIHNIYNKYDSFGPYGNLGFLNVSVSNAKFGHTDLFDDVNKTEGFLQITTENHNMSTYIEAIENGSVSCSEKPISAAGPDVSTSTDEKTDAGDFSIEGKWKSIGEYGFGQAQPGAIVAFDETHCNFFSPSDTYALYQEDGRWRLDCTDFLFANTVSFTVEIIDSDNIYIYYGSNITELKRVN